MSHERRVFLDLSGEDPVGRSFRLSASLVHHLGTVLRLRMGDSVTVVDTSSRTLFVGSFAPEGSVLILERIASHFEEIPWVTCLVMALCKGRVNELVVEKAAELGVARIIFFQAARSVAKFDPSRGRKEKLLRVAEEASRQSSRVSVPEVFVESSFREAQSLLPEDGSRVVCSLSQRSQVLATFRAPAPFTIAVGPEGDWTLEEEEALAGVGFQPLSLGGLRLRSETAAIAAIAMLSAVGMIVAGNEQ